MVAQVVNALSTTSVLTSSSNPSTYGTSVTFYRHGLGHLGHPGRHGHLLQLHHLAEWPPRPRSGPGRSTAQARPPWPPRPCPSGTTYVEAIYSASGNYGGSTSNVVTQVVIGVPSVCATGGYDAPIIGNPGDPFVSGTNGNDFIYAFGASYWINGFGGNDCIDTGDGNNVIYDGNGNDGVSAGNGSNTVILGRRQRQGQPRERLGRGRDSVTATTR